MDALSDLVLDPVGPLEFFDPEAHRYFLDGDELPSVTTVLKDVGLIDTDHYTEEARERGSRVHEDTEALDRDGVHQDRDGYLPAYLKFRRESGAEVVLVEFRMFSARYRTAGTLDRIFRFPGRPRPVILDIKSGGREDWHRLQLGAYDLLYQDVTGECGPFDHCDLYLRDDGTFRTHWWPDPAYDMSEFLYWRQKWAA